MTFYERYAAICTEKEIDPCSQRTAEMLGVTRATISVWNTKGTTPKGEIVSAIAEALGVSSDYLLGRTDDPTDYTDPELIASLAGPVMDEFNGDVKKTKAFHDAVDADVMREQRPYFVQMYERLDDADRLKVDGYLEGLLANEKYARKKQA